MFEARLRKRHRHLKSYASRWPTNAWRVYDRDIPQYPWTVDVYGPEDAVIQSFARRARDADAQRAEVIEAVSAVLGVSPDRIVEKTRTRQKGAAQYERQGEGGGELVVREGELSFAVNLTDYIDTGLFLDHRPMRRMVAQHVQTLTAPRVLNLFAYTGAFSVWAAAAGAQVVTVDLSNTYLQWAERNFELNGLPVGEGSPHTFLRDDVTRWLWGRSRYQAPFDIIVLDPPTFSRSKRMDRDLDVQRDHLRLLQGCVNLLARGGTIYFSTNFQSFTLDPGVARLGRVEEITALTVPDDFRAGIHRAWTITYP